MNLNMIREFHWLTKTVLLLTGLLFGLILATAVRAEVSNLAISLAWILVQVFPIILAVIIISIIADRIRKWVEVREDLLLSKLDPHIDGKSIQVDTSAKVTALHEKFDRIEKKLDHIEEILEKVGD
ncbi:MAG: hypothetical protein LUQ40_01835 [Methanomicrobiales archaeon]|nr:hypothetical protein [Methanomicrobiales archaeon]